MRSDDVRPEQGTSSEGAAHPDNQLDVVLSAGVCHVGPSAHGGVAKSGRNHCGACPHRRNDRLQ